MHDVVTSVLRNSSVVTEPPGAGGWGRMQLQERQNAGILLSTPKGSPDTVQKLLGWAEHSEVLPSVSSRCLWREQRVTNSL